MKLEFCTILLFVLLPAIAFGLQPIDSDAIVSLLSSDAVSVSLSFDLADVTRSNVTEDSKTYTMHAMTDAGSTYEYGKPQLPAITRFVVVPPDVGLRLAVESSTPRIVPADHPPALFLDEDFPQPDKPYNDRLPVGSPTPTPLSVYPLDIASMGGPVVIRGVRLVTVTTHPVQYDPASNSYIYHDNIQTDIVFTDEEPVNPAYVPSRRYRSPHLLKFLKSLAINADDVGRDDPSDEAPYVGHCLVVAHENCVEYAAPYIEWRRKSGWKMEWLSLSNNDARSVNTVKREIQNVYDEYLENGIDPFDHIFIIGDLRRYWGNGPQPQWVLEHADGPQSDWDYACLEGNDNHADVGISRWASGSPEMLRLNSLRHFAYAAEPPMEEPDWFTRGAVYAQRWGGNYHISLATNVQWGITVLKNLGFEDVNTHINLSQNDRGGGIVGPFIRDQYNARTNVMIGRAQNGYFSRGLPGVEDNDVFPIDIYLGGHQEVSAYSLLRSGTVEHPKGAVAVTTSYGNPSTIVNSILWLEIVSGFLQHDMTFGWSQLKGLIGPVEYFQGFEPIGRYYRDLTTFLGDPALQYWKGVPLTVEAEFDDIISANPGHYNVTVNSDDGNVEGALVTLYAPGDMPDFDDDDYAAYTDMQKWTERTDEDGAARFFFDDDIELIEGTPLYVTVSGRELLPFMERADIEQLSAEMKVAEFSFIEVEGNDNREINPGETILLSVTGVIIGDEDLNDVTATVTSESPWIEIVEGELSFGDCDADEEIDCAEPIEIRISESCPDGESRSATKPRLLVQFNDGEDSWSSWLELSPVAPDFEADDEVENMVIPRDNRVREFNLRIENIGGQDATGFTAVLRSRSFGISIVQDSAHYPATEAGESNQVDGDPFRIKGRSEAFPGGEVEMMLVCRLENGFVDTARFSIQVGEEIDDGPIGPDDFGYYCLDDTDNWIIAPTYNWIEISREEIERDYNGVSCNFEGDSPQNIGEATVVDLGFSTEFYGRSYEEITICSNGYILMGDQEEGINFQNWPLDRGFGSGCGVLAPFWDWLEIGNGAQVYHYHDEEAGRFIVEWYELNHRDDNDDELTFEAVLYDKDMHPSISGSQKILFQYRTVEDIHGEGRGRNWTNRVPYASVGISSPDGTTGINYCFNDIYPDGAERIEAERALIFTTDLAYKEGIIYGSISDEESGDPIEDATILTDYNYHAVSDVNGNWRIDDARADHEFSITVTKSGFNDISRDGLIVGEEDSLEIDFALLHPEFRLSEERIDIRVQIGSTEEVPLTIINDGNGELRWMVLDANEIEPFDHLESVTIDGIGSEVVSGVIFAGNRFYVSAGNYRGANFIYILTREGVVIDSVRQFGLSRYGMTDMTYDGELIWGGDDRTLYGFTPQGERVEQFNVPIRPLKAVTWDSDRSVFWTCSDQTAIYSFDRDGQEISQIPRHGFRITGLCYWSNDPDGYPLYIFHRVGVDGHTLHKINPDNGDTTFVTVLEPEEGGIPAGACFSTKFDIFSRLMMNVTTNSGEDQQDVINIWHVANDTDWLTLSPSEEGTIPADGTQDLILEFNAPMDTATYYSELMFQHNADGGEYLLPITINVALDIQEDYTADTPAQFELFEPYPNPFNSITTIGFNIDRSHQTVLTIHDISGRTLSRLYDAVPTVGYHRINWNASELPSGIYLLRIESEGRYQIMKIALIR